MTDKRNRKSRLSREILGLLTLSLAAAAAVLLLLSALSLRLVDRWFAEVLLTYTENQLITAQMWTTNACMIAAVFFFATLFLLLLGRKLGYIGVITRGVDALREHRAADAVPEEGRNELTELARSVNYLAAREQELRQKEETLQREREQLIRTLSHDIRTPLTSILSYTEYLTAHPDCDAQQRQSYLALMDSKARQIRQLTDILLDGGSRRPEPFEDARLLLQQLADRMEAELEDEFDFAADFSACAPFAGSFDVAELQRIFDNLTSNITKYADPAQPVRLTVSLTEGGLLLRQSNAVRPAARGESHRIGLLSIRRIAQHYGGTAEAVTEKGVFTVTVTFSDF